MTISSIYSTNIYSPIKIASIRKEIIFFSRLLTSATKNIVNICLDIIHFGMISNLISFDGEYYEYHGRGGGGGKNRGYK